MVFIYSPVCDNISKVVQLVYGIHLHVSDDIGEVI